MWDLGSELLSIRAAVKSWLCHLLAWPITVVAPKGSLRDVRQLWPPWVPKLSQVTITIIIVMDSSHAYIKYKYKHMRIFWYFLSQSKLICVLFMQTQQQGSSLSSAPHHPITTINPSSVWILEPTLANLHSSLNLVFFSVTTIKANTVIEYFLFAGHWARCFYVNYPM